MKNFIKTLYALLKALPIVIELVEMFAPKSKTANSSDVPRSDKDIIENV